jgi:hypothetical protein
MGRDRLLHMEARTYHKEYYKRNKEQIRAKRMLTNENTLTEDVKQWKIDKENDPYAFYPFHNDQPKTRHSGELLDVSGIICITPSSCSVIGILL